MTKRIKQVFSNYDQVLHLWANQTQPHARCRNAYFDGTKVYSYGSHYLLGELIKHKGQTVALINNNRYSVTTNQQISSAHHACDHIPTLSASRDLWSVKGGLKLARETLLKAMDSHFKQIKFSTWDGATYKAQKHGLRVAIERFNTLCDRLKEKSFKIKVTAEYIAKYNAHIKHRLKREKELNTPQAIAAREVKRLKLAATKHVREIKSVLANETHLQLVKEA